MALVVAGTVAPMAAGDERRSFAGRVWIDDEGSVAAVTGGGDPAPSGFAAAPVVDVGEAVIHPGFVDLHSHLGYNTLPLWVEPTQTEPYLHHNIWPGERSYQSAISWPSWTLLDRATECVLAYVGVRAIAGGTTTIQGWPGLSRRPANPLVRSVDNDAVGPLGDPVLVSTLTLKPDELTRRAARLAAGHAFVYHCAEGQPGSRVTDEFDDLATAGCLHPGLVAIHCSALGGAHFARWGEAAGATGGAPAGTVVWSPFSNLWLYGTTTEVPEALAHGLAVSLGTDWGPSGTKNPLGEVKVARLWSDHQGWGLSDHDLVRMITCVPGDAVGRAWQRGLGRLEAGALGDVAVVARRRGDVWENLVSARDADVVLVAVGGRARYGTKALMEAAGERTTTTVRLGRASRRVVLVRPDDPSTAWNWREVLERLDAVRGDAAANPPRGPSAGSSPQQQAGGRPDDVGDPPATPPIAASLDMPGGPQQSAGPPPPGRTVDIAPIEALHHSTGWLASIKGRGFHNGVLDGLGRFYR